LTAQKLDRTLSCYRIGDPDGGFPIFDVEGSRLQPGRWNTPETAVIYASLSYATAMLEKLVHGSGRLPPNQHYIEIALPFGLSYETVTKDALPGWQDADQRASRSFGAQWVREKRSAVLFVPSFVARIETNVLINPRHADFAAITKSLHVPVWWDNRLFQP
jgi:RES domain-containing protein